MRTPEETYIRDTISRWETDAAYWRSKVIEAEERAAHWRGELDKLLQAEGRGRWRKRIDGPDIAGS